MSCPSGFPVETSPSLSALPPSVPSAYLQGAGPANRTVWFGDTLYLEPTVAGIRLLLWLVAFAFLPFPMEDFPEFSQAWETLVFPLSLAEATCYVAYKIRDVMRDLLASPPAAFAYLLGLLAG